MRPGITFMKLILVRHGETDWNRQRRVQGITDIPLNQRGVEQAERLARALRNEHIENILSSPLKRALQTAEIVNRCHGKTIRPVSALGELDQGDFEGRTISEIMETNADFLRQWAADPASVIMPGGESLSALQRRALLAIEGVLIEGKNTLIVSHNFTIMTILCTFRYNNLNKVREFRVDPASISIVEYENGVGAVTVMNDVSHLEGL